MGAIAAKAYFSHGLEGEEAPFRQFPKCDPAWEKSPLAGAKKGLGFLVLYTSMRVDPLQSSGQSSSARFWVDADGG